MARRKQDPPKAKKQYSLSVELVKKVQLEAVHIGCFDSAVVERALSLYFKLKERRSLEEFSQQTAPFDPMTALEQRYAQDTAVAA